MCTCVPSRNHVKLVNNCYPDGDVESPKHSELAYLSYYALSRPVKLLKVSAYLEKCLQRDLSKRRWGEVITALKIFQQLARDCRKNLNLFAKNVVRVTEKCLSEDKVGWVAGAMFHDFCLHFDAITIGVDEDLTIHMDCLVTKFCEMACYTEEQTKDNSSHRRLGLFGVYSILVSPLIRTAHAKAYYTKLTYGVLTNVLHSIVPLESVEEDINWGSFTYFHSDEKYLEQSQMNIIALKCLQQLLDSSRPLNMFLVVSSAFSYIEKYQLFENPRYSVDLVLFMMSAATPTYRYIVVNEVLRLLNDCPRDRADRKQVTLVKVIEDSLSSLVCIGISILEYASSLVGRLIDVYNNEAALTTTEFPLIEVELKHGLTLAISSLGSHLYYMEQINDILAFIINKLQSVQHKTTTSSSPFELDLLKCMSALVEKAHGPRSDVPLPIITPTLAFLTNDSSTVRNEYTNFLSCSLRSAQNHAGQSHSPHTNSPPSDQITNLKFRSTLHKKLLAYGQRRDLTISDYNNIFTIFKKLIDRELHDELTRALPILFYLQQSATDRAIVDQFLSDYLVHVGDVLKIDQLSEYANQIVYTRESDVKRIRETSRSITDYSQELLVSPEKVREILMRNKRLQTLFPDLNERVNFTYEPNSTDVLSLIYSNPSKARYGSNAEQSKHSMPIIKTVDVKFASPRKFPQVEQFKDALKANCTISVCEDDSDSSDLLTGSYTTVKRSKGSKTDISHLLNSISAHSLTSVTSLVETPCLRAPTSSAVI